MARYNKNGDEIKAKSMKQKRDEADIFGYNAETLKGYLQLSGYQAGINGLVKATGWSTGVATRRLHRGDFSRRELHTIMDVLHLTPEQMQAIFFNGREGVVKIKGQNTKEHDE